LGVTNFALARYTHVNNIKNKLTIMKKNFLQIVTIAIITILFIACKKEQSSVEPNIFSEEDNSTNESTLGFRSAAASGICCSAVPTSITRNADFLGFIPGNYNICNNLKMYTDPGHNIDWFAANYVGNTPKVGVTSCFGSLAAGACDLGYVSIKGNKSNGESISQDGHTITMGQKYYVRFNARIRPGSIGNAKLGIKLSNLVPTSEIRSTGAGFSPNAYKSEIIVGTTWKCYDMIIKDNSNTYSVINIGVINQYSGMLTNYAKVDIDNIKIWQ
jgi:hypothetical protein